MLHGYLRPLANFAHVVETGSITGAANRLGLSPSVISESVKTLEARVGEPLLERRRTGVSPTARGLALAEEARQVVDALDRALGTEDAADGPMTGVMRISLPVELAQGWFDRALFGLMEAHPDLELHLMVEDAPADYAKHARDLFVRVSPKTSHPDLVPLYTAPVDIVLVAAPRLASQATPGDVEKIQTLPYLGSPETSGSGKLTVRTAQGPLSMVFPQVLRVSDMGARLGLLRAGLGIMGCLRPSVAADLEAGRLIDLKPGQIGPGHVYAIIGSPRRRTPARVRRVAEALAEDLPGATLAN